MFMLGRVSVPAIWHGAARDYRSAAPQKACEEKISLEPESPSWATSNRPAALLALRGLIGTYWGPMRTLPLVTEVGFPH